MQDEIKNITILIEEVSETEKDIKIKSGGKTYKLWKTKKNGDNKVAYKQYIDKEKK